MPAKSKAQGKLMRAVAHNPEFAKKVGIPQVVGREFTEGGATLKDAAKVKKKKAK